MLAGRAARRWCGVSPALAGAWWRLSSRAAPTNLAPGGQGLLVVAAEDLGDAGVNGEHLSRHDHATRCPAGLVVSGGVRRSKRTGRLRRCDHREKKKPYWNCALTGVSGKSSAKRMLAIPAYETLKVEIPVEVQRARGLRASLAEPGERAPAAKREDGGVVPSASARLGRAGSATNPWHFGLEEDGYQITPEERTRRASTRRPGSHPFQLTSTVSLNQTLEEVQLSGEKPARGPGRSRAHARICSFSLPPGLLGTSARPNSARRWTSRRWKATARICVPPARRSGWRR